MFFKKIVKYEKLKIKIKFDFNDSNAILLEFNTRIKIIDPSI